MNSSQVQTQIVSNLEDGLSFGIQASFGLMSLVAVAALLGWLVSRLRD